MELGEPAVISCQDEKKKKKVHVAGYSLIVNSSETKEEKQKLQFSSVHSLSRV